MVAAVVKVCEILDSRVREAGVWRAKTGGCASLVDSVFVSQPQDKTKAHFCYFYAPPRFAFGWGWFGRAGWFYSI